MTYISAKQAKEKLGQVSIGFVYSLVRKGAVKATKVGGRVLVDEDSLNDLINLGKIEAIAPKKKAGKDKLPTRFRHFSL